MVLQVRLPAVISFLTVLLQVSFGRPCLLLPSTVQHMVVLGSASGHIRHTCPSHLLILTCVASDVVSVWRCSSSLVIGQNTPGKSQSLCAIMIASFQHSRVIETYIKNVTALTARCIAKARLAFRILAMVFLSESPIIMIWLIHIPEPLPRLHCWWW